MDTCGSTVAAATAAASTAINSDASRSTSHETASRFIYPKEYVPVASLQLEAHGINIFQKTDAEFYSNYMPWNYGGSNVVTPDDPGAFMLNFCLYPGTYQPSGHINVSRAREFYLSFAASTLLPSGFPQCHMLVMAKAINFLLISDGSAVLRYST
jgi:hypothetical protein